MMAVGNDCTMRHLRGKPVWVYPDTYRKIKTMELEGQDYFVLVKDLRLLEAPHELEDEADLEVRPTAASSDGGGKSLSEGDDKHGSGPAKRKRRRPSASLGPRQPEAPPVKQTICSFWRDDKCRRGLFCAFAHGADELGSKIPPLPKGVNFREGP